MKTYKQNGWDVPEGYSLVVNEFEGDVMADRGISDDMHNAILEASPQPPAKPEVGAEPVGFVRHFHYSGIARNGFSQEAVLNDGAPHLPDGAPLYTAPHDAQAIRDAALSELRGQVMEMQGSLETFGPYSQEAAGVALDGVLDAIDELMSVIPTAGIQAQPSAEPIYQVRRQFMGEPEWCWRDASKDAYDLALPEVRRIVCVAPPDAQAIRDEGVKAMAAAVDLLNSGIRALKGGAA